MGTEILKTFSHLQNELEEAKNSLKGVDANIKRLIGRDPSELQRPGTKRPLDEKNARQPFSKFGRFENNELPKPRNRSAVSVFKRLSEKVPDEPIAPPSKGLISKVIAAPKEVPSRQEMLDKQSKDTKYKERNRRMFGALLGTLQKFQQDECKLKKKEEKRTQIEKKIEEHEQQEKEEVKKERHELFMNRKKKQQEIKMIELKMLRMKEYAAWEQSQKPRASFITTKAKPHIHYLPRRLNEPTKELLEKSKQEVEEQIATRKQAVAEELANIEERMKRNFEPRNQHVESKVEQKPNTDRHNRRGSDSENEMDDEINEEETKEKSPSPEVDEKKEEKGNEDVPIQEESETKEAEETSSNIPSNEVQTEEVTVTSVEMTVESVTETNEEGSTEMEVTTEENVVVTEETTVVPPQVVETTTDSQEVQAENI